MDSLQQVPQRGRAPRCPLPGSGGFTLIELLVTMAIAGILLAIGGPAMMQFLADQAAASNADEFAEAVRLARTEAMKRGTSVTLCASSNSTSCANSDVWASGWIITAAGTNQVLKVQNTVRAVNSITAADDTITFAATGIVTGGSGNYVFLPVGGDTSKQRTVAVNVQGRVRVTKGS